MLITGSGAFKLRRWLLSALGGGQRFRSTTKIIFALLIFFLSFSIKSLVAVDISPVMHTVAHPGLVSMRELERDIALIVEGRGILPPDNWDATDTSLAIYPPGYPIFVSAVYSLFGKSSFNVQIVQNAINSMSAVLIFLIAGELVTWRVGVASGLLAAASHHLSYYSNFTLPDSLCALPILVGVYLLVKARPHSPTSFWFYALAGVMLGLSLWLRSNALLLGPFLFVLVLFVSRRRRQVSRRAWILALAPFLVIAPITIRNQLIYGEFVPLTSNLGIVLLEGIGDASGDRFGAPSGGHDQEVAEQEAILYTDPRYAEYWASPDGINRDRYRIKRSLDIIVRHPVWFAGAMLDRMWQMLNYSAYAPLVFRIDDKKLIEAGERARGANESKGERRVRREAWENGGWSLKVGESLFWLRLPERALQRVAKETGLLFILIGAPVMFFLSRRRALFILMVPLYYFVFQSVLHTEFRYTLPMHYFVFIFAATVWVLIAASISAGIKRITPTLRIVRAKVAGPDPQS
jgi:Dolichyl-phosphate-mannose-protein mannosyltransferase